GGDAAAKAPDPAIDAVAAALGVQPDRAARLIEALDIVGSSIDQVRLVRVFQGEQGPHGAISRGEFHYVVDRVAGPPRRRDRGGRDDRGGRGRGGDRGGGGGGGGGGGDRGRGGPGGERRDKPRGLGSLKVGAQKEEPKEDDRPGRGEMPRAGIGWQLTAAPRDFGEGRGGRDRRPPRRGPGGPGGPGGRGPGGGGPGGPGGDRRDRRDRDRGRGPRPGGGGGYHEPRLGPDGQPLPREPRLGPDGQPLPPREARPPREPRPPQPPREPRLGPDGQPLPPRPRRERKPIGPDQNGLGPDGTPWDPERRAKRRAERDAQQPPPMNAAGGIPVEAAVPSAEPAVEAAPKD
ncbi:MAG TPA: hypothetical protein VN253_13730, partial [Kofleriaceae bacterium]|nr:hypothetical protein [Kofleriaceae bacterium]